MKLNVPFCSITPPTSPPRATPYSTKPTFDMKFSIITSLLALGASSVLATPTAEPADAIASVESRDTSSSPSSAVIEKRATLATKKKKTDTLMWNTDLEYFQYERRRKNPSYLVWASDGCTDSPDYPFKWPFVKGCYRHDFGYRNYKKQKRFNKANKKKIDLKFHKEYVLPMPKP